MCGEIITNGKITDVPGILVGHWTNKKSATGCTVLLFPPGTTGGVDADSSAPATREIKILEVDSRIEEVHALVFTGGSAFGLDCAGGVMKFLERRKIGHKTSSAIVPIVPAAAIYDLSVGNPFVRPGPKEGEKAARSATKNFKTGAVGAGTGATCSKWMGISKAIKTGIATASMKKGKLIIGALAVVNPVGNIIDAKGNILIGYSKFNFIKTQYRNMENTVLVAVATNAKLDKIKCNQAAKRIRDGIAKSIYPAHTKHDGDVGFFFSCGQVKDIDLDIIFNLTTEVTALAIRNVAKHGEHD